ncbi:CLUMA_CG001845, isoform A [Clunio marinus]|uniref:CLUMA_CG001845, isoform A n=1 Tax=Clunio marinus TaxID=568069 RepID=A0A1J1HKY1_9DIPT|nr:CLUMA_CG001845, isoform A [Clunio marinus]
MMGSTNKNPNGIRVCANDAHFISLGNGRLSTGVTLFDIPIGNITIGSSESCDIIIKGADVQDVHCSVTRKISDDNNLGDVILNRVGSAKILVEGVVVDDECYLQQGSMITIGENSYLRFNFPRKAALLKTNAMDMDRNNSTDKYDEVLRKSLNTSFVNFAEFNSEKLLNNNDKVSEKMKNLKLKTNDSYPKISNMQTFPFAANSLDGVSPKKPENVVDEMQQLEQVLKMFVDYNNDNHIGGSSSSNRSLTKISSEKINLSPQSHQNRIKTNGSLPKNFHTKEHGHSFEFYDSDSKSTDDIEIYKKPQSPRTRIKTFVSSPTSSNNNNSAKCLSPTDNNDKSYTADNNKKNVAIAESYEKDYEKLIKSFEEKFRMDIYNIQNCEKTSDGGNGTIAESTDLNSEKNEILSKIRELKILISDIQLQESETYLESDVEKSLVLAEMSNEKANLLKLNDKLSALKTQMKHLEVQKVRKQKHQEIQQIKLRNVIKDMEAEIKILKEQKDLSVDSKNRLQELEEKLEVDKKTYEDLEFHYLEEETDWLSLLEEYKENINTFSQQIEDKKNVIQQLEQTKQVNENLTQDEQKTLEKRLFNLKQKLENEREKLKSIDKMLLAKKPSPNINEKENNNQNDSSSSFSAFDSLSFDRNSNLMSKSFNENMFFNRNKIEVSHFDFNLNLNVDPSVNEDNEEEKDDKQKKLNNAMVKEEDLRISPIKHNNINDLSRNSQSNDTDNNASPLMMPKYHSLSSISTSQDDLVPSNNKNNNNSQIPNGYGTLTGVVQRQTPKQHKRPLTRYLPNFSLDFNLKHHIESAGHQIQLCPHVIITATSCRGFLNKVGAKPLFSNLRVNNRWFVFDRERQMLVYYSDKNEKKPRGGAYFNAITDVYFDHSSMKNNRTFIVKTKSKMYTLQAPSQQACSIWIDVIITGAQGKILEYDK